MPPGPGTTCTVCKHLAREQIDQRLVEGVGVKAVGAEFGIHFDAVYRHRRNHLSPALQALRGEVIEGKAHALVDRIEKQIGRIERVAVAGEKSGSARVVLDATREMRGMLELLGKASGELKGNLPPLLPITMWAMPYSGDMSFRDCPHCGLHDAQMNVLAHDLPAERLGRERLFWSVLSCPRCGGGILLETTVPGYGGDDLVLRTVPSAGVMDEISDLPDDVAEYYRGAVTVLQAGVPDAAAVQLRRTLEAAAAHHGISKGYLVTRIRHLIAAGLITKDFGDVLDHVRVVGNAGAHAGPQRVDLATAQRALRFTTQVLRNLFEIPAELKRLNAANATDPDNQVEST